VSNHQPNAAAPIETAMPPAERAAYANGFQAGRDAGLLAGRVETARLRRDLEQARAELAGARNEIERLHDQSVSRPRD
jgi:hypothetical protein